ncbi:MAG: class I SAM-dependent methyltransferase [Actinomycetota bacterium]
MENQSDNTGAYEKMARFYDKMMGDTKYPKWKILIAQIVNKYNIKTDICLDVACGTGNISRLLAELGFGVVGVDISPEMIQIAKSKMPKERFVCSDIRNLALSKEYTQGISFAVSFYDSLNYLLTDEDMIRAFRSVYSSISSGTIFLFDMNTIDHVKAAQQYKPRILDEKEFYSVYSFSGEDRFWILDIDIFIKEGESYRLVREKHTERGYDEKDIAPLLKQVGFDLLEVIEERKTYEDGIERLGRIYFVAKK